MEDNKFEIAKELKEKINQKESRIRHIDRLLNSCGLTCKIDGTPKHQFVRAGEYSSYNKEFITKLLINDSEIASTELEVLNKQFNEL